MVALDPLDNERYMHVISSVNLSCRPIFTIYTQAQEQTRRLGPNQITPGRYRVYTFQLCFQPRSGCRMGDAVEYNYVTLILGIMFLTIFIIYETIADHPPVPIKYFSLKATSILVVVSAEFASFGIWEFYYYRYSKAPRAFSPLAVTAQNVLMITLGLWPQSLLATSSIASGQVLCSHIL